MYIAQRDIRLSGKSYVAGEVIPKEAVIPSRVTALLNSHYIAEQREGNLLLSEETEMDVSKVSVTLNKLNLGLFLDAQEVSEVFEILQMNVEEGTEAILQQDNENVLLVVKEIDTRKGIKMAAQNRLKAIGESFKESGDEENDI